MTSHHPADHDDEAPLDPAAERLRRKLVRLLAGSLGVMLLGLIAVFAAIVYKTADGLPGEAVAARITLPAGARLVSADLDGDHALLRVESGEGETALLLVDLADGAVLGRYELAAE